MASHGFHVAEEPSAALLTLILDKKGIFGKSIAEKLHEDITTVLVTAKNETSQGNMLVIPYTKPIPEIPEGNYSHMFFIWDGRVETLHVLEPLLQKAATDKAQFLFITDYHCYNEKLIKFIHQEYARASVIFTGDVFGNDQYKSPVTVLLEEAQEHKALQLDNVGLSHVYPVFFFDVVAQILKIGFGVQQGKVFLAFQSHGMTELSLAHVLQKIDPLLKIDFKNNEKDAVSMPSGEHLFDTDYDIIRKIQDAYTDIVAKNAQADRGVGNLFFAPLQLQQERKIKKKRRYTWVAFLLASFFFLLSPIVLMLLYAGLGGVSLYAATDSLKRGSYQEAATFSQTGENLFSLAFSVNTVAQKEFQLLFLQQTGNSLTQLLQQGSLLARILENGATAIDNFSLVTRGVSKNPSVDFSTGINAVKNVVIALQTAPTDIRIDGVSVATVAKKLQPLSSVLDISSTLFGFSGEKTYMVLFQNNTELRPGGGFIGSYAVISVNQGKVVDFSIHDVYDADGQLKGHIEPPFVIRRFVPEQNWYLRDSNFDVDFSKNAANAAYFLQQETGQKVDGVIGIDLTFVKDILAGIGPVYVPEYSQTVSADNFFLLTESHAEKKSFAGSTQKKDFLAALFSALQVKLTSLHGFSPKAIMPLVSALASKDVVLGFSDPLIQGIFTINGLSSSLWDARVASAGVVNDFTGINEANIGVNKANYFVTRSVDQHMAIDKAGRISGVATITYANASVKGQWPGGPYRNYLRIILPLGATLSSIRINGEQQQLVPAVTDFHIYEASGFVAPKGLEVDSATEQGKELYGFLLTIPEGTTQKVEISYTLWQRFDMTNPTLTYNGLLFRQPGVDAYPYTFSLTVPENFSLLQKPEWIQKNGNTISFEMPLGEDIPFTVEFAQK